MSAAAFAYPAKSAEAFRTISEVALELDVPQHVLRFWESRFSQIKPVKRAGGRRYYRPEDVDLLKGIRALLYSDGFTIKGVQKVLKERGLRHVAHVGRGEPEPAPAPEPVVSEKIVYVEKPAAPVKKPRPTHLRAVRGMSLPFFPETGLEEPEVAEAVIELETADIVSEDSLPERERLEALLEELTGLKARLQAARGRLP
ncbi:MAG: MerR family transcriptional regulator [Alphaproteobacteria bacterium]|nr:MerR family transcriptional regulator [Alphaproteobacteria bacterium]